MAPFERWRETVELVKEEKKLAYIEQQERVRGRDAEERKTEG